MLDEKERCEKYVPEPHFETMRKELQDYANYKKVCKKAECDNEDKIGLLWAYKKVFTVPWLVAYDYLLK